MPPSRPQPDLDGGSSDTLRIPEPYGSSLQVRGARASRRIYRAMGVWPWEIVPESPPKIWAINLLEDLALVVEHVAKDPDESLEDLRAELRKSLARDRKPSYTGKLMAQDVHAAKKRFVKGSQASPGPERKHDDPDEGSLLERRSGRRRRNASNNSPGSPSGASSRRFKSPNESDEYMASSIIVAPDPPPPPSPPQPRNIKALKRSGSNLAIPDDKRVRPSSPEGSRLSAAQSLMLFSSPMSAFHMTPSFSPNNTNIPPRSLYAGTLHEPLQPAAATFISAVDAHSQSLRESLITAQKEVFPHRTVHQEAMSKLRSCQGGVRLIQEDIDECKETLGRLHAETAEQDALAPQLQALQENNMSLPPEIAEAIRNYDSRRSSKILEIKKQEAQISAQTDKLEQAREELDEAEKNCHGLDAEIQRLQSVVTRATEAARLAHMFGVVVQLGPEGLASIERIYPEIGSLMESLLAARGNLAQQSYLSEMQKAE